MLCPTIDLEKMSAYICPELPKVRKRMLKHLEKVVFLVS